MAAERVRECPADGAEELRLTDDRADLRLCYVPLRTPRILQLAAHRKRDRLTGARTHASWRSVHHTLTRSSCSPSRAPADLLPELMSGRAVAVTVDGAQQEDLDRHVRLMQVVAQERLDVRATASLGPSATA